MLNLGFGVVVSELQFSSFDNICWNNVDEKSKDLLGEHIGEGRHRKVYEYFYNAERYVLKVPTRESGIAANFQEANESADYLAKAEIDEKISLLIGAPVLRMEYVEHVGFSENPDWTWTIDGGQVGYTSDGRLVAYDWDRY